MLLTSENLSTATLSVAIVFGVAAFILPFFSNSPKARYFDSQSWAGLQKQWFARFRAGIASLTKTQVMLVEGYNEFSKNGKIWALPQFFHDPLIMLPVQKIQEVMALPDEQLEPHEGNAESFQPKYTVGEDVVTGPHTDIVRRQLTRRLPTLTADVHEELVLGMEQTWDPQFEWKSVKVFGSSMEIVSRAANRVFCGTELCRNPKFLDATREHAVGVFGTGFKLSVFPPWMHPIVGPFAAYPVTKNRAIAKRICVPVIRERVHNILNPDQALKNNWEAPNDALQWLLEDLVARGDITPKKMNMDLVVRQLLFLNMVAIHTTSMVITNTILDLYSHPDSETFIAGLREECERVFAEHHGQWSKDAVNQLVRVDSVIRETMRISTLTDFGFRRVVRPSSGITLADGTHIPHGVMIAFPNYSIQRDPAFYPEKHDTWDGFRFSAPREQNQGAKKDLSKVLEQKNQNLTAIGPDFLQFGLGRHACPGRFFASQEIKLMLAHIIINFDIRVPGGRPPNFNFAGQSVPSEEAEIQIKLRQ